MVAPTQRGVFITRYEAIRNLITSTIIYVAMIFHQELYAWVKGVPVDVLFKHISGTRTAVAASILYFGSLIFWCLSVYDSYKNYKRKKRQLELLLENENLADSTKNS